MSISLHSLTNLIWVDFSTPRLTFGRVLLVLVNGRAWSSMSSWLSGRYLPVSSSASYVSLFSHPHLMDDQTADDRMFWMFNSRRSIPSRPKRSTTPGSSPSASSSSLLSGSTQEHTRRTPDLRGIFLHRRFPERWTRMHSGTERDPQSEEWEECRSLQLRLDRTPSDKLQYKGSD